MFWLLTIGGSILGLLVIAIVIGFLLPAKYAFSIERTVNAPPKDVWQLLHQPTQNSVSGKQCRGVRVIDDAPLSWVEDLGSTQVTYRVMDESSHESMTVHAADSVVPMQFDAVIRLTPTENGTRINASVNGRIDSGTFHVPLFRLIVHMGGAKAGYRGYLHRLAQTAESAER